MYIYSEFLKMKKVIMIIFGVIILTVILLVNNNALIEKNNNVLYNMEKELNDQLSGVKLVDVVCVSLQNDTLSLSDIVRDKTLIYFYSELHCNSCYENQLSFLHDYFSGFKSNILILGSYMTYRNFAASMNNNEYKLPLYYVDYKTLDSLLIDYETPLFFTLNSELEATNFYIFNDDNLENNHKYFQKVKALLGN